MEIEVTGTGRVSKESNGALGGSVWESRMRIDQLKGGIKVFGVLEQEDEERASKIYNHRSKQEDDEKEGSGVIANSSSIPQKRIGVSGVRRRTWKPQPGTLESPIQVISEKPVRAERSPIEVTKSRSESTDGAAEMESREGKVESLQKAGQKISGGAVSCDLMGISDSGSWKQFNGSPGKVTVTHSKKKVTAKSHNDQPKKSPSHVGQFKIGPKVLGRNDVFNHEEGEEEFFDIKEISVAEQKSKTAFLEESKVRISLFREKPAKPISTRVIKQQRSPSPVSKLHQSYVYVKESSYGCKHDSKGQKIVRNLSDLVMWRDVPKSAIAFGLGTLISVSSYMSDTNTCFISTIAYLGLACLSANFLYRSIVWRGCIDIGDTSFHELSKEEVLCLTKTVLPYLNGFLRKLRTLISGDPAASMKLAVLLFVLARCGSFVNMWNMIRLGFFIAFTIPKLWSLCSTLLADQGKYWVKVSQETWDSCHYKEAVAAAVIVLTLVFSSNITGIWAGLMLLVAFRYYQRSLVRSGCRKSDGGAEEKWLSQRQHSTHGFTEVKKAY